VISALQPLAELPGVQLVMLITPDGVPIAIPGKGAGTNEANAGLEGDSRSLGKNDAFAAIASGWLGELERTVAELSWSAPRRAVLRAARGTLVMHRTSSAILLVLLVRGLGPEEVRLSMDGTIARIERNLRGMGRQDAGRPAGQGSGPDGSHGHERPDPPGALPIRSRSVRSTDGLTEVTENGNRKRPSGN
jgi:predicted regulator of Ras-like GTPase activity (Roadblock/LC7/MglB family)